MTIALLCPSKGRPDECKRMVRSVYNTTNENICIYIAVSKDDFDDYAKMVDLPEDGTVGVLLIEVPEFLPTVHKWNKLSDIALSSDTKTCVDLLMVAADDMVFTTPCWDTALREHYEALENKIHVYHLLDERTKTGTPHPIVTKEYIEAMGYFLPPIFLHWFIDLWTVGMAVENKCFTHLKDYELKHIKPSDNGKADRTHRNIRDMGWHDRDTYVHERLQYGYYGLECQRLREKMKSVSSSNFEVYDNTGKV